MAKLKRVESMNDVNKALQEIGKCGARLAELDRELEALRQTFMDEHGDEMTRLSQDQARLEADVRAYVSENREEIPGNSLDLQFGSLEFRTASSIEIDDEQRLLDRAQDMGLDHCIRYKASANKQVLATMEAKTLAKLGARIVEREKLTIKTGGMVLKEKDAKAA